MGRKFRKFDNFYRLRFEKNSNRLKYSTFTAMALILFLATLLISIN